MNIRIITMAAIIGLIQSCAGVPKQYKDDCADGACKHMQNRCKQMKAASSRQTQYGVTPIKDYEGPALVDGMWSVRCGDGKVLQILDSKFKDISSYQLKE